MNSNEKNSNKENQNETTELSAEMRLIDVIAKAEQRIANGESYMKMSELKKKLEI